MKILVVDDSPEDRLLAITYLSKAELKDKIDITESPNLTEGMAQVKTVKFDAIFLDLALPETKGLDTIKTMLNCLEQQNKEIPVIVLTGNEDYKLGREALDLGCFAFLIKGEAKKKEIERTLNYATYNNALPKRFSFFRK